MMEFTSEELQIINMALVNQRLQVEQRIKELRENQNESKLVYQFVNELGDIKSLESKISNYFE